MPVQTTPVQTTPVQTLPVQMGQYGEAEHVVVHISDTHFLAGGAALYGRIDTDTAVKRTMSRLECSGLRPDAIVFTGDVADLGEPDAYRRIRAIVQPAAERLGSEVIWVMGNHDTRRAFRRELLSEEPSGEPVDRVVTVNGLRIIAMDTTVPGFHHGDLTDAQLDWLRRELTEPAPHGTLVALHHPPIPTPLAVMTILELQRQERLADVIAGSDIRAILGGHLHYPTTGMFAGIPVSVAAATCYTMDLGAPARELVGVDGGQAVNLVSVYADQVVFSVVPVGDYEIVTSFDEAFLQRMEALIPQGRIDAFSRVPAATTDAAAAVPAPD